MKETTIKDLAFQLQRKIDTSLESFNENKKKLSDLNLQAEKIEKKMADIVFELEPVQLLVVQQNPHLEQLFESLKRVYGKEDNGSEKK